MGKYYLIPILWIVVVSCTQDMGDTNDNSGGIKTPAGYREMITVIPKGEIVTINSAGSEGVFIQGRRVSIGSFSMAKYETTWELWEEVYNWVLQHGYRIGNTGTEGHGSSGTGDPAQGWSAGDMKTRPVTDITWRDVVIWCNAYSDLCGFDPVYYTSDGLHILRVSENNTPEAPSRIDTEADLTIMKRDKNGFRLPLEIEWEFAARGGSSGVADWNFPYSGGAVLDACAWYEDNAYISGSADYGIHPVGTKHTGANRLGIFDMSGNAAEWCWDWDNENGISPATPPEGDGLGNFAHRITRGGSWRNGADTCEVTDRNYCRPFSRGTYLGFRLVQTIQ